MLKYLGALLMLAASASFAFAVDVYPTGALLGNYQYSQLGPNAPSGTILAEEIYFYDSLLATPGNAPVSPTTPLPVNCIIGCTGGGGGAAASFTPNGSFTAPLSVSTTSAAIALPTGTTVAVFNTGSQTAFVNLGASSIVATASQVAIAPGGAQGFTVGANTYLAAITASGTTTLNIAGGAGLFTPYAGGGSGSGGGGAISAASGSYVAGALADGAVVTLGTKADAAWGLSGSASEIAIQKEIALELQNPTNPSVAATAANQTSVQSAAGTSASILMGVQGSASGVPIPVTIAASVNLGLAAGSNTIGNVGLNAGSNIIGSIVAPSAGAWAGSIGYAQGAAYAGEYLNLEGCIVQNAANSLVAGNNNALSCTNESALRTSLVSTTGNPLAPAVSNGASGNAGGLQTSVIFNTSPTELASGSSDALAGNQYGGLLVDNEGNKPSNSSAVSFTPPTGVIWSECGSSTKTIRVREIDLSGLATTAGSLLVEFIKTSSAPSGGTSTSVGWTPNDTTNTSNTSSGLYFTAAPTAGTQAGIVRQLELPLLVAGAYEPPIQIQFGTNGAQSIALRSATQCLEIYTPTSDPAGGVIQISAQNTEE